MVDAQFLDAPEDSLEALHRRLLMARVRSEEASAARREIARKRETQEVLSRQVVEHAIATVLACTREAWLTFASRLTPELRGLNDEAEIYRRIDQQVKESIRKLRDDLDAAL